MVMPTWTYPDPTCNLKSTLYVICTKCPTFTALKCMIVVECWFGIQCWTLDLTLPMRSGLEVNPSTYPILSLLQQTEPKAKIIPPDVHVLESNNKLAMPQIIPSTSLNPTSTSMRTGPLPNKDTHVQKRSHCYPITSLTMNFHNSIPLVVLSLLNNTSISATHTIHHRLTQLVAHLRTQRIYRGWKTLHGFLHDTI